jgi:Gas vesicle synthesis protein GvpO
VLTVTDEERRRKRHPRNEEAPSDAARRRRRRARLSAAQVADRARHELAEITCLEAESATALERGDDGTWRVTVELLELSRTPETDDVLGSYEAQLDETGELLGYRCIRRYARTRR